MAPSPSRLVATLLTAALFSLTAPNAHAAPPAAPAERKAYCIDFNWGPGGPNAFSKPGLWADADPTAHVAWYQDIGCNIIQTFAVSCNDYAWYKNGADDRHIAALARAFRGLPPDYVRPERR